MGGMDDHEEVQIRSSRVGDAEAFGGLVKRHAGRATGVAFLLLGNRTDAVDASQEAFLRAWRGLPRFRGESAFFPWYSAILRNVCREHLRRRSTVHAHGGGLSLSNGRRNHREAGTERLDDLPGPVSRDDPALLAERNERTERLWAALLRLSGRHREIIVMSHFQELRYRDIADLLGIPIGTVMSRLHQARKALREELAGGKR